METSNLIPRYHLAERASSSCTNTLNSLMKLLQCSRSWTKRRVTSHVSPIELLRVELQKPPSPPFSHDATFLGQTQTATGHSVLNLLCFHNKNQCLQNKPKPNTSSLICVVQTHFHLYCYKQKLSKQKIVLRFFPFLKTFLGLSEAKRFRSPTSICSQTQ